MTFFRKKLKLVTNLITLYYYINTNEIPGELLQKNMIHCIFTHEKITVAMVSTLGLQKNILKLQKIINIKEKNIKMKWYFQAAM